MPYFPGPRPDELPPDIAAAVVGWARIRPAIAWLYPRMPREWTAVLECDPIEPSRAPLLGWLFLYDHGRIREVDGRHLEVVDGSKRPL